MGVKAAIQAEFLPYITEENKEQALTLKPAYINTGKFEWYDREGGPPSIHSHERNKLNEEVKKSLGGPTRGMGKIAADTIASHERLLNTRNETRLQCFVRSHVRAAQISGALQHLRDLILNRVKT